MPSSDVIRSKIKRYMLFQKIGWMDEVWLSWRNTNVELTGSLLHVCESCLPLGDRKPQKKSKPSGGWLAFVVLLSTNNSVVFSQVAYSLSYLSFMICLRKAVFRRRLITNK